MRLFRREDPRPDLSPMDFEDDFESGNKLGEVLMKIAGYYMRGAIAFGSVMEELTSYNPYRKMRDEIYGGYENPVEVPKTKNLVNHLSPVQDRISGGEYKETVDFFQKLGIPKKEIGNNIGMFGGFPFFKRNKKVKQLPRYDWDLIRMR